MSVRLVQLKTDLQQDADGYYLIGTLQNWKDFAVLSQIETSPKGKLVADINLGDEQAMIGSFNGIFDGQGHTLTVNLTSTANVCGVFRYVADGATIQNLRIAGTINGAHRWIGGFVGQALIILKIVFPALPLILLIQVMAFKEVSWLPRGVRFT